MKRRRILKTLSIMSLGMNVVNSTSVYGLIIQSVPFPGFEKATAYAQLAKTISQALKNVSIAFRNIFGGIASGQIKEIQKELRIISKKLDDIKTDLAIIKDLILVLPAEVVDAFNKDELRGLINGLANHQQIIEKLNDRQKKEYVSKYKASINTQFENLKTLRDKYVDSKETDIGRIPICSAICIALMGYSQLLGHSKSEMQITFRPFDNFIIEMKKNARNILEQNRKNLAEIELEMQRPTAISWGIASNISSPISISYNFSTSGEMDKSILELISSLISLPDNNYNYLGLEFCERPNKVITNYSNPKVRVPDNYKRRIENQRKFFDDKTGIAYSKIITNLYCYNSLIDMEIEIDNTLKQLRG